MKTYSYSEKATAGLSWMFTSHFGLQGISLIVNIVLARLLFPVDFGAVALVTSITHILWVLAEMGLAVALIQRRELSSSMIDSAFSATIISTLIIVVCLWLFSGQIAKFFNLPIMKDLLKIVAFAHFFRGINSLFRSLLLRAMRYKDVSIIDFISYLFFGISAVTLALIGFGAFSIAWGQIIWTFSGMILGYWKTKHIPRSLGRLNEMFSLFSFGIWVSTSRVLKNASGYTDSLIIGKFFNATLLGGYNLAQRVVMFLPGAYSRIIDQVMLPIYSTIKNESDVEKVQDSYWKTLNYSSILLAPTIFLIFLYAYPFTYYVLGEKWLNIVSIIKILCIGALAKALGQGVFDAVVYSLGHPRVVTVISLFRIIGLPAAIIIGSKWNIIGVAWGFSIYCILERLLSQILLLVFEKFSFYRYFREAGNAFIAGIIVSILPFAALNSWSNYCVIEQMVVVATTFVLWCFTYYLVIRRLSPVETGYLLRQFFIYLHKIVPFKYSN